MKRGWIRLAVAILMGLTAYLLFFRNWQRHWGATMQELSQILPGDSLVVQPLIRSTHAVNIHAPAAQVWPWLVQLGQGRGGFYTYDFLENLLGADIHNVTRIEPGLQSLRAGDAIRLARTMPGLEVKELQPGKHYVLLGDTRRNLAAVPMPAGSFLISSWAFVLQEVNDGSSRLLSRWSADWGGSFLFTAMNYGLVEWADFVMERRMLLAIRDLAEKRPGAGCVPCWGDKVWFAGLWLAGIAVVAAAFGRQWRAAWLATQSGSLLVLTTLFIFPPRAGYVLLLNLLLWSGVIFCWRRTCTN